MISEIVSALGGSSNISEVSNCMTRLRVVVKNESAVDEDALRSIEPVLGVVHDRSLRYEVVVGPGKSRTYADRCKELGIGVAQGNSKDGAKTAGDRWSIKSFLKVFADIFVPLIPGVVAAGLCQGLAGLLAQLVPSYQDSTIWMLVYQMLSLVGAAFIPFLSAWVGYRAAERFGATPILGGIIGMVTCLSNINTIAVTLGLYNESQPLASVLSTGKGGILAAIVGVLFLSYVEKRIRRRIPDSLDVVLTPLLSLAICVVPYVLLVMPALGLVSSAVSTGMTGICMSENPFVRMVSGFIGAALFLPLVAAGMHHGFVALYSIQLAELGYVTFYPALAMAGAGQVGAAAALWVKAKRAGNKDLAKVIAGALPAGVLGVGEPLVYGVTLPLGRPFLTAGVGAGFGGAFIMLMQVAATSWGPSGVLALFLMTAGPNDPVSNMLYYLAGLLISCTMGCLLTWFFCRLDPPKGAGQTTERTAIDAIGASAAAPDESHARSVSEHGARRPIKHGAPLFQADPAANSFSYTIQDDVGIHARPAGRLVELAKKFDCSVLVSTDEKEARADSIIDIMSLGAKQGTRIRVEASGPDAQSALRELRRFFETEL